MKIATSITKLEERIQITDGEEVVLDLPVRLNVTDMCSQITQKRVELQAALESGDAEQIGEAFVALYEICLGKDNTAQLLEYYMNDYVTMINDLTPFFTDVIFPAVDTARERLIESRKKVKAS